MAAEKTSTSPSVWRRIWERWKVIAHVIGTFQARLILSVLYLVILPPFALIRRLGGDRLGRRPTSDPTYWRARPADAPTLEAARKQ